jgi:branched-subunit amino acid transport protein
MNIQSYLGLLVGMGLVTYIPRWLPLYLLSNRQLPSWLIRWLDLIPVSILSALLAPALVTTGTPRQLAPFQPEMLVAVPTFLFALKTRSLGGTVVVGMFLYWLTGRFF